MCNNSQAIAIIYHQPCAYNYVSQETAHALKVYHFFNRSTVRVYVCMYVHIYYTAIRLLHHWNGTMTPQECAVPKCVATSCELGCQGFMAM